LLRIAELGTVTAILRLLVIALLAIGALAAVARRVFRHSSGREAAGGILVGDPRGYEAQSRRLFGSLFDGIAADVAKVAPEGARILEIGSGPGHLSERLARGHGFDVVGLDLDPEMVARAQANAEAAGTDRAPKFVVGDVAHLPFEMDSFDLVVSTFSMHHWSDPAAGLDEIARVLRPDGRALIWDLKTRLPLFHSHTPDPEHAVGNSDLRAVRATPWRWPWRFSVSQRLELVPG
jgi:SAM-dependent methyltransferase